MGRDAGRTRREFLGSTAAVGSAALAAAPALGFGVHSGVDETVRVGLVGCGGRGTDAVGNALTADPQAVLVAVGDAFADRAERCLENLKAESEFAPRVRVDPAQVHSGFDSYRGVIDACDVVLLASPPHFRPRHFRYAVEQGRHAFVEKPVAVDAPGVRSVMESCREAERKGLSVVSGLCWRYDSGVRETVRRLVEDRAVGEIVAIESSYNSGPLWHRGDRAEWSRMEYQVRNWIYHTWLSGDHILEQAIHSLDKAAWLLRDAHPVSAMAMGGRQQRVQAKYGDVYDHFTVFYEYPTGQRVYFTCRQQKNTSTRVDERVLGTDGEAEVIKHVIAPKGKEPWRYQGPKPSLYVVEHEELFGGIRSGAPINDGHYMCNSTMIGVMGRMAAYSGKTLSWDECFESEERLGPAEYAWGDAPEPRVAVPGESRRA